MKQIFALLMAGASTEILAQTPAPAEPACWVLDDFSKSPADSFPADWRTRYEDHLDETKSKKLWWVVDDGGKRALRGVYGTHTITLVRKIEGLDLAKYPWFHWDWKAVKLPAGGDESTSKKNDSAASVYLVWEESWPMKGSFIRFAWSSTRPKGETISKRVGYEKIVIVESGAEKLNAWQSNKVNALELSQKLLKKKKAKAPMLLSLNTDADGTKSSAEALYANFRFCKE